MYISENFYFMLFQQMEGQLKDVWNLDRGTPMHTELKLKSCQRGAQLQSKCEAGQGIRFWDLEMRAASLVGSLSTKYKHFHFVLCSQKQMFYQFLTPKHRLALAPLSCVDCVFAGALARSRKRSPGAARS